MTKLNAVPQVTPTETTSVSFLGEKVEGRVYTNSREVCVTYRDTRTGVTLAMTGPIDTPPERVLNDLIDSFVVKRFIL